MSSRSSSKKPNNLFDIDTGTLSDELPNPPIDEPTDFEEPEETTSIKSPHDDNPFRALAISGATRVKQVWAIGGGKGGVGKSLISSNIAITLARQGFKVVAVDLDLGGANLHTALGIGPPNETISDFLAGRVSHLNHIKAPTTVNGLEIISGAQDSIGVTDLSLKDKIELMQQFRDLDADYVIFDLGAGTNRHNLDFFLYADIGMVVLLPEPTSIENAYRFIKSVYYRRLLVSNKLDEVQHLIKTALDSKNELGLRTPADLFREINRTNPEVGVALKDEIEKIELKLIVNQARTQTDIEIGFSAKSVCKKYFGIDVDYVGYLDYDSAVWQSIRRKKPLITEFPNSQLVSSVERICSYLLKKYNTTRNKLI